MPPADPDDRWLQFGISPVDAYMRWGASIFEISPCPTEAFWVGPDQAGPAVLIVRSPVVATLRTGAPVPISTAVAGVFLGYGLPEASLTTNEPAPLRTTTLSWNIRETTMVSYSVVGESPELEPMRRTACRSLRGPLSVLCG